ncbi:MAG: protease modulator HflK, partial [Betaproteobacteria bacterium]
MKFNPVLQTFVAWPQRLFQRVRGMFNLNDSRWGRDESSSGESPSPSDRPAAPVPPPASPPPSAS